MADLDQLTQKYAPVISTIQSFSDLGATLDPPSLDGDKLYLKGSVPSEVIANRVWDVIKQVDAQYADLHHEISTSGGPSQSYTVKSGDNLSKISDRFYGSANHYTNIATASNISDPNKIQVGQENHNPGAYLNLRVLRALHLRPDLLLPGLPLDRVALKANPDRHEGWGATFFVHSLHA